MADERPERFRYKHQQLGSIDGFLRGTEAVQFRDIPYGDISGRFRQATLVTQLPYTPYNAMIPGPDCPQSCEPFPQFYYETRPEDHVDCMCKVNNSIVYENPQLNDHLLLPEPDVDEFRCLSLNITVPLGAFEHQDQAGLPVLVFFHGGSFKGGSQNTRVCGREFYDAYHLVRTSVRLNRPFVVVTVNYRVGPLGFLASSQLETFNRVYEEAVGNYGLHDQRLALDWVSRHIADFHGNPGNVTIHGTGAGGVSCYWQYMSPDQLYDPKFARAICGSGAVPILAPRSMQWHSTQFQSLCRNLDLNGDSGDIVQLLQSTPTEALLAASTQLNYCPVLDNKWIRSHDMSSLLQDWKGLQAIMMGLCHDENAKPLHHEWESSHITIDFDHQHIRPQENFLSSTPSFLADTTNSFPFSNMDLMHAYPRTGNMGNPYRLNLTNPKTQEIEFRCVNMRALMMNCCVKLPVVHSAVIHRQLHPDAPVYLYYIHAKSWYKGLYDYQYIPHHGVTDQLLFSGADDRLHPAYLSRWRPPVAAIQKAWIDFCYGDEPWAPLAPIPAGDVDLAKVGPIYVLKDYDESGIVENMETCLGEEVMSQWTVAYDACKENASGSSQPQGSKVR